MNTEFTFFSSTIIQATSEDVYSLIANPDHLSELHPDTWKVFRNNGKHRIARHGEEFTELAWSGLFVNFWNWKVLSSETGGIFTLVGNDRFTGLKAAVYYGVYPWSAAAAVLNRTFVFEAPSKFTKALSVYKEEDIQRSSDEYLECIRKRFEGYR